MEAYELGRDYFLELAIRPVPGHLLLRVSASFVRKVLIRTGTSFA